MSTIKMGSLEMLNSYCSSGLRSKTRENMEYEVERLASFHSWPDWAAKRPTELAENGFFYCGKGDEVKCFSCGGQISDWSVDADVASEHSKRFPACSIVLGNSGDNKKLGSGYRRLSPLSLDDAEVGSIKMEYVGDASQEVDKVGVLAELDEAEKFLKKMVSQACSKEKEKCDSLSTEHPQSVGPYQSDGLELDPDLLRYEFYRRQTFDGRWPENSLTSPSELAKAGFYYFGPGDTVKCAFCKGRLLNWRATDNAMSEHCKHYPQCPFVRGVDTRNVSFESIKNSEKPVNRNEQQKKQTSCERLGVMVDKPKYPEFALESARENTFKNWPKPSNVSVQDLVKAGFFYVGFSDNVKCFFCGGGLRNWEVGDEPWTAHARWYSRCGFLKLSKGEDFIEKAKNPTSAAGVADSSLLGASSNTVQEMPVNPAEVDAWLHKPDVKSFIGMGFSVNLIRKVIENKLKTTGETFKSSSDLIDAVIKEKESVSSAAVETTKTSKSRRKKKNKNRKKKNAASSATVSGVASPFLANVPPSENEKGMEDEEMDVPGLDELLSNPSSAGDEELTRLHEEYLKLKEERTCKICMDAESSVVFLPCGHIICCTTCAPALRHCPLCRAYIKGSVRGFFP